MRKLGHGEIKKLAEVTLLVNSGTGLQNCLVVARLSFLVLQQTVTGSLLLARG